MPVGEIGYYGLLFNGRLLMPDALKIAFNCFFERSGFTSNPHIVVVNENKTRFVRIAQKNDRP